MKRLFPHNNEYFRPTGANSLVRALTTVAFSVVIIMLMFTVFVSDTFAKIVESFEGAGGSATAAGFAVDYTVTGYDDESFMCYNETYKIVNDPHYIAYSVRNYKPGEQVNGVLTRPVFSLTVPKRIFETAAFQFTDDSDVPITTQFSMEKLLDAQLSSYSTADYVVEGKLAVPAEAEEVMSISRRDGVVTAVGTLPGGGRGTKITVTESVERYR